MHPTGYTGRCTRVVAGGGAQEEEDVHVGHGGAEIDAVNDAHEYMPFLKHSWCWPLGKAENAGLWEEGGSGDVPRVMELASWLALDDGWLPKASVAGTSLSKGPSGPVLVEQAWRMLPVGLQRWCLDFEPSMWERPSRPLVVFEGIVADVSAAYVAGEWEGGDGDLAGEYTPCDFGSGGGVGVKSPSDKGYYGYKSPMWMVMLMSAMVAHGLPHELCSFVLEPRFGIPLDFAKLRYAWNAPRHGLQCIMSMVDKFVSLCMGCECPPCVRWEPVTSLCDPSDWVAGGVHASEAAENWSRLHEVSSWVMQWIRDGFWVEPREQVPKTHKKNAAYLRPERADMFDSDKFAFVDKKLKKDAKLGVHDPMHRVGGTGQCE